MTTILFWMLAGVGAITTIAVAIIAISEAYISIREWRHETDAQEKYSIGRQYMEQRLTQDAWWFGEDVPTMKLIRRLGEGDRVDAIREDWRHERAAQAEAKQMALAKAR